MSSDAPPPYEGASVLLVEDDYLVGVALRRMLESLGCVVSGPIADLPTARRAAREADFDCGLLDVNIRGGSSEDVAEILHERGTPFLFITGYQSPQLVTDATRASVRLRKPVELRTLARALGEVIGGH
jgi:DNA-binding NtrC family response regulator